MAQHAVLIWENLMAAINHTATVGAACGMRVGWQGGQDEGD